MLLQRTHTVTIYSSLGESFLRWLLPLLLPHWLASLVVLAWARAMQVALRGLLDYRVTVGAAHGLIRNHLSGGVTVVLISILASCLLVAFWLLGVRC